MTLSRNRRFGLITFFVLLIIAIVVTREPWKGWRKDLETSAPASPPANLSLRIGDLRSGYPASPFDDAVYSYRGFDLAYNEDHEQASWVAYVITREEVEQGKLQRTDNFRADTLILTGSASLNDYRGSGYDRGHLAPAADMNWSEETMSQSFLLSNMSPQAPSFNRGIWKRLEEKVRDWAVEKDSLYVVTGPVLTTVSSTIGPDSVGIPGYFFKVLADISPPSFSMIAFLLPNEGSSEDFMDFAVSVDSLERFTGYNFFATAPGQDAIEWYEGQFRPELWK